MLHHLRFLLFIIFISSNFTYAIELKNDKDSILKMGMEMSNMRNMLKAYIMIGASINYKNPTKTLKDGIIHYEDLLVSVKNKYPNNSQIQESIANSFQAWKHVKGAMQIALKNESLKKMKEGAIFIHGNIRTVIKEMANIKKYLLKKSTMVHKKELDASIEIAASARRLSAHYMMDLWHLDDPTIQKHWNKGLAIYGNSLTVLKNSTFMENKRFRSLYISCKKYHIYFTKMGKKAKIYSILIDKKAEIAFQKARKMTQIILESE